MSGWTTVENQKSPAGAWVVSDSDGNEVAAGLDGLAGMTAALEINKVLFGALRVHGEDIQENVTSERPKICRVNWVGEKVPAMKKMQALQGKAKIAEIWNGAALELDANKAEEISMNNFAVKLLGAGGAHKPTQYNFGPDQIIALSDVKNNGQ